MPRTLPLAPLLIAAALSPGALAARPLPERLVPARPLPTRSAAAPPPPSRWVAVRADASHCLATADPQPPGAPCVRLDGAGTGGAVAAGVVAQGDGTWTLRWARPTRDACLAAPPYGLADLDLQVRVDAAAVLPVVAQATTLDLGQGARLELRPGHPVWPGPVVHVAGLVVPLPGEVPTATEVTPAPGAWVDLPDMQVAASALPPVGGLPLATLSTAPLAAEWDQAGSAVVLRDACARLALPVEGGVAPGRPPPGGRTVHTRKVEGTLVEGTVLTLPAGRPVGQVTANLVLGPWQAAAGSSGEVPLAATLASAQGGRTCLVVPTSAELSLPTEQRSLVLCTATHALK
ncbi:hypothetical protein L6R53_08640 [Myxococcota bacterium]|nr:hypothetical protein [Myxococcota bacterium]